ncbi:MAG: hypothetical protein ACXWIN_04815, partial [Burkholderiaceae bacterium]
DTEIDKLYALYQADAIDKRGFAEKYKPLAARQAALDDEMPALQAEIDVLKITQLSQGEIISEARDLYSRWLELPEDEKRRIVEAITKNIIIGEGEVEINLYYAPTIPRGGNGGGGTGSLGDGNDDDDEEGSASSLHYGERATQQHGFIAAIN